MGIFHFKQFSINQEGASMKVGTDAMILGSLIPEGKYVNALDVGTGTGVLALMIAQKNPKLSITAIDIDADNVALANQNFCSDVIPSTLGISTVSNDIFISIPLI